MIIGGSSGSKVGSEGMPQVCSQSYLYSLAEGDISGHGLFSKIGFNGDIGATEEIMSPQGGVYVFPTSAANMIVVSSSAEDDSDKGGSTPGTGILTLTIYYLDSNYAEKSTVITMNGTSNVDTANGTPAASDIFRIQNVRATTVGTGGYSAGNISIKKADGSVTYGYIAAGTTRQRQLVYTVPANKTLYITNFNISSVATATGKYGKYTLRATYDDKIASRITFFMPYSEVLLGDGAALVEFLAPLKLPERVDVIVVAVSTGTSAASCSIRGWLE